MGLRRSVEIAWNSSEIKKSLQQAKKYYLNKFLNENK